MKAPPFPNIKFEADPVALCFILGAVVAPEKTSELLIVTALTNTNWLLSTVIFVVVIAKAPAKVTFLLVNVMLFTVTAAPNVTVMAEPLSKKTSSPVVGAEASAVPPDVSVHEVASAQLADEAAFQ